MDPWNLIGWGFIGYILLIVVIIPILIVAYVYISSWIDQYKKYRANTGKLKCEADQCRHKATRRTPNGYFCAVDWPRHDEKFIPSGSISYAIPLDYIKGDS